MQRVHFSVDDVSLSLRQITQNGYASVFGHPFFAYLRALHKKYGAAVVLYCFFEADGFSLADCTDRFRDELSANAHWLKFGFHAYNKEETFRKGEGPGLRENAGKSHEASADGERKVAGWGYDDFCREIVRIAGTADAICRTVRLHRFAGQRDEALSAACPQNPRGIRTLLCADGKGRASYWLSAEESAMLERGGALERDGIAFCRTDLRFDHWREYKRLFAECAAKGTVVAFAHERTLNAAPRKNLADWASAALRRLLVKRNIGKFFAAFSSRGGAAFVAEL